MSSEILRPNLKFLTQEYVLIQAWKKTASYIRSHNWYSDNLELDRTAVNLPKFLKEVSKCLSFPDQWNNDPLRLVLAPKSQRWFINSKTGKWEPNNDDKHVPLRPLAHVSLKDQVAASAVMLCLANRVESLVGDPRSPISKMADRKRIISYGNRLFCDKNKNGLQHHWGASKLYRAYYQDYRSFLSRPEKVAEAEKLLQTNER